MLPMRIVIASDLYLPVYNGVAQFSQNLAIELARRGNEVLVIAASPKGRKYQEKEFGYTVAWLTSLRVPFFPLPHIAINPTLEVKKLLAEFKPDVVHIQTPLGIGLATRSAAKKMDIPVVTTNHAMPENIIDNIKLLAPVAKQAAQIIREYGVWFYSNDKVDYITMPTQAAIDMYKEHSKEVSAPVKAVSCGIDLSRFSPRPRDEKVMRKFGVPTDKPIILYAGRLDSEKHLSVLIEAARIVHKSKDIHLVLSGRGNDEDNLKQQVEESQMQDYVTFLGRVSDADLPKVYLMGSVFVMPSPAELQSIVTMEAMASGLPIVVVDAGAVHELCSEGQNGYICKTDDPSDMAAKIKLILGNDKLRSSMSKASLELIKQHDIRQTATEFESIYNEVRKNYPANKSTLRLKTRA